MNARYRLTERTELFANIGVIELDGRIFDSPLVDETVQPTLFIGGSHTFGSIYEPIVRTNQPVRWSWRVNYGYQAQGSIVGDISQGDFTRSVDANTRIAGVTFSRLLNGGPHFDFYGRFGVNRHLERGAQSDFSSVTAYVMAIGKGYFPWSDEPSFRWGFGMGMSYAQRVPIVEQIKQQRRDRNTTRFLNYLEMTLDFPVGRWLESGPLRDCYTGLTAVHRSGIFASADILGGVSGASDWITAHLECFR
jgi:MipA family protein